MAKAFSKTFLVHYIKFFKYCPIHYNITHLCFGLFSDMSESITKDIIKCNSNTIRHENKQNNLL